MLNQAISHGYADGVKSGLNDGRRGGLLLVPMARTANSPCDSKSLPQNSSAMFIRWATGSATQTGSTTSIPSRLRGMLRLSNRCRIALHKQIVLTEEKCIH